MITELHTTESPQVEDEHSCRCFAAAGVVFSMHEMSWALFRQVVNQQNVNLDDNQYN